MGTELARLAVGLRSLSRWYPTIRGTGFLSSILDSLSRGFRSRHPESEPVWAVAAPGDWNPALSLNLNHPFQRNFYYFTPAFGRHYLANGGGFVLDRFLRPGGTFLDIGANLGFFAFLAAQRVGSAGQVYAFEPEPSAFASLSQSALLVDHRMVRCRQLALAEKPATATRFHLAYSGNAHSLVAEVPERRDRYSSLIQVAVESIDHLVDAGTLPAEQVNLIKIDVEGGEPGVVSGMVQALRVWRTPPLFIEVRGPRGSTRAPNTFLRVNEVLEPLGYSAYRINRRSALEPATVAGVQDRADLLFHT